MGDFNIHIDESKDHKTKQFYSMIDEFDLKQHITFATHKHGHILDLVITDKRHPPLLLGNGPALTGYVQSDHYPMCFDISCIKPPKSFKVIQYRNWKSLDGNMFSADLDDVCKSANLKLSTDELVAFYNNTLSEVLNKHLTLKYGQFLCSYTTFCFSVRCLFSTSDSVLL